MLTGGIAASVLSRPLSLHSEDPGFSRGGRPWEQVAAVPRFDQRAKRKRRPFRIADRKRLLNGIQREPAPTLDPAAYRFRREIRLEQGMSRFVSRPQHWGELPESAQRYGRTERSASGHDACPVQPHTLASTSSSVGIETVGTSSARCDTFAAVAFCAFTKGTIFPYTRGHRARFFNHLMRAP